MLDIQTTEELIHHAIGAYHMTECTGDTKYFEELIKINNFWWTPDSAEDVAKTHRALTEMMKDASLASMVIYDDEEEIEVTKEYEFGDD